MKIEKPYLRMAAKRVIQYLSKHSTRVQTFYEQSTLIGTPPGLLALNFVTQRLLQINGDVGIPVNFTSRVTFYKNIKHHDDRTTLLSFALSGGGYIQAMNGLRLGSNFLFAPGVKLISADHDFHDRAKSKPGRPITIGDNVWLGANVIVLPEVEIGNNCIVGAGSVVTRSFPEDNLIIAGNPAVIIKRLPAPQCAAK